jgi:uncharacterized damage-inducible protein DinB
MFASVHTATPGDTNLGLFGNRAENSRTPSACQQRYNLPLRRPADAGNQQESPVNNREFFLHLVSSEHPRFLGVLKAAPGDTLDYQPHPRSRSARQLIGHLLGHEQDLVELLETGTINHRMEVPFDSVDDAVRIQTAAHSDAIRRLADLPEADWDAMGRFLVQGNVIMEAPRRDLAWMLLLDAVHHRGQLSTYLRPMGGKVPSIYGPSADTMVAHA